MESRTRLPPQVAKIARPEAFALGHPEALPRPCRDTRPGRALPRCCSALETREKG
jgi:hypothetical protein